MPIELIIPDAVASALRFPEPRLRECLLEELAVALYADGVLGFGKARQLAGVGKYEFGKLLTKCQVARHFSITEFKDDLAYASDS